MTKIFYFFVNFAIDDEPCADPIITTDFIGDIGDYVERDGIGYFIRDYAIEDYYQDEYVRYVGDYMALDGIDYDEADYVSNSCYHDLEY